MSPDPEGPQHPPPRATSDPKGAARPALGHLLADATVRRRRDHQPPSPDLLDLFDEQLDFIDRQYPQAAPSTTGAEHLDELARVRANHLRRSLQLETADRIVAMIVRLVTSSAALVGAALLGRHIGAW